MSMVDELFTVDVLRRGIEARLASDDVVIEVTALFTDYIAELDSLCRVSKLVSLASLAIGALLSYATASGSEEEERLYLEKVKRIVLTLYKVIDKLKHDKYNYQLVAEALEEIRRALPREEAL
jgi:hypothetical protein